MMENIFLTFHHLVQYQQEFIWKTNEFHQLNFGKHQMEIEIPIEIPSLEKKHI